VQQRITILATLALIRLRRGDPVPTLLEEAFELACPRANSTASAASRLPVRSSLASRRQR